MKTNFCDKKLGPRQTWSCRAKADVELATTRQLAQNTFYSLSFAHILSALSDHLSLKYYQCRSVINTQRKNVYGMSETCENVASVPCDTCDATVDEQLRCWRPCGTWIITEQMEHLSKTSQHCWYRWNWRYFLWNVILNHSIIKVYLNTWVREFCW